MTRASPPHSGVGPPTSRVGSGTSCQPVGKAPPTGPSSSRDKVGSGADNCPRLHCGVKGREEGAPGGVRRRGALGAPLLPPCPQPGSAGPPRLPPCLRVPILIPRVGGSCLPAPQPRPREDSRSLPSSGRRGYCGLVGTEGGEAGARGATAPPAGEEHAIPAAGLDTSRPRGPLFSVTRASGPITHHMEWPRYSS